MTPEKPHPLTCVLVVTVALLLVFVRCTGEPAQGSLTTPRTARPTHDLVHSGQEDIASRWLAMGLEFTVCFGGQGQLLGHLLHSVGGAPLRPRGKIMVSLKKTSKWAFLCC